MLECWSKNFPHFLAAVLQQILQTCSLIYMAKYILAPEMVSLPQRSTFLFESWQWLIYQHFEQCFHRLCEPAPALIYGLHEPKLHWPEAMSPTAFQVWRHPFQRQLSHRWCAGHIIGGLFKKLDTERANTWAFTSWLLGSHCTMDSFSSFLTQRWWLMRHRTWRQWPPNGQEVNARVATHHQHHHHCHNEWPLFLYQSTSNPHGRNLGPKMQSQFPHCPELGILHINVPKAAQVKVALGMLDTSEWTMFTSQRQISNVATYASVLIVRTRKKTTCNHKLLQTTNSHMLSGRVPLYPKGNKKRTNASCDHHEYLCGTWALLAHSICSWKYCTWLEPNLEIECN